MGTPPWRGPEEEKKTQHFTVPVVLVEMGTLLKLARVSMLPCCAHAGKIRKTMSMHN